MTKTKTDDDKDIIKIRYLSRVSRSSWYIQWLIFPLLLIGNLLWLAARIGNEEEQVVHIRAADRDGLFHLNLQLGWFFYWYARRLSLHSDASAIRAHARVRWGLLEIGGGGSGRRSRIQTLQRVTWLTSVNSTKRIAVFAICQSSASLKQN